MLADPILDDLPFASGDNVLAFVNGMGGTPLIELYIVYNELRMLLAERGVNVTRSLVGSYITSLEMAGCSITLLRLDDELTRLWDAPVSHRRPALGRMSDAGSPDGQAITAAEVARWIRDFAAAVAEHKDELTRLDSAIGDADHGINMDRGMTAVVAALDAGGAGRGRRPWRRRSAMTLISKVGGASGPLYGTLFLQFGSAAGAGAPHAARAGRRASRPAVAGVRSRGKAEPGDKTMVDALMPAAEALRRRSRRGRVLRRRARRGRRTRPRRARAPRSPSSPARAGRAISASGARGTRTRARPRVPSCVRCAARAWSD